MKTIIMMAILATIAVFGAVQYVDAEIFSLRGVNDEVSIVVIREGGSENAVILHDKKGWSVHFDVKLKEYKSGGFSLKSPETGLALWAHPTEENYQYKVSILTSEGLQRYLTKVVDWNVVEEVHPANQTRVAPKSSVGVDITKYNIPTDTKRSAEPGERPLKILVKSNQLKEIMMDKTGRYDISIKNLYKADHISYANMTMEISRDGNIVKEVKEKATVYGNWSHEFEVPYPTFYPGFCYDVKIITQYGNLTDIQHDDFKILVDVGHLDFKRVTEDKDTDYNEQDQAVKKEKIETDYFCNKNDKRD